MKIYTKGGDKGKTSLVTGTRVKKNNIRLEAYGTIDELNSFIGLIRSFEIAKNHTFFLIWIQKKLFNLGSQLANDGKKIKFKLPEILSDDVLAIEKEIDRIEESLEPLAHFILPGGHQLISYCHIARTISRRAERRMLDIENLNEIHLKFINRLSDYFFMLSRILSKENNVEELKWIPQ